MDELYNFGGSDGKRIRRNRELMGMSIRQFASYVGTSTRRMKAIEKDEDPKPRKEKRTYPMVFIPFLGYSVRCRKDSPVRDTTFDLKQQQTRILKMLCL